ERRPTKGDDDDVKRPENVFVLFCRRCCKERALSIWSPFASAPPRSPRLGTTAGSSSPRRFQQGNLTAATVEGILA
ncbi:hypothetical protein C8R43DRAFT_892859, partial [Mycena crocata]